MRGVIHLLDDLLCLEFVPYSPISVDEEADWEASLDL